MEMLGSNYLIQVPLYQQGTEATVLACRMDTGRSVIARTVRLDTPGLPADGAELWEELTELLSTLDHPALPQTTEVVVGSALLATVTDYPLGELLSRRLAQGPLERDRGVEVCLSLCELARYLRDRERPVCAALREDALMLCLDGSALLLPGWEMLLPPGPDWERSLLADLGRLLERMIGTPEGTGPLDRAMEELLRRCATGASMDRIEQLEQALGQYQELVRQQAAVRAAAENAPPRLRQLLGALSLPEIRSLTAPAVEQTRVYPPAFFTDAPLPNRETRFTVEAGFAPVSVRQHCAQGRTAVLCVGDPLAPGGGFSAPTAGTEERLLQASTLYPCLAQDRVTAAFYEANRDAAPLYTDRVVAAPGVWIWPEEDRLFLQAPESRCRADVLVCAAPARAEAERTELSEAARSLVLRSRIRNLLEAAMDLGAEVLVLTPLGWAGDDPALSARAFHNLLAQKRYQRAFAEVVFAVPPEDADALAAYREEFKPGYLEKNDPVTHQRIYLTVYPLQPLSDTLALTDLSHNSPYPQYLLGGPRAVVGRLPDKDITIPVQPISREHALLEREFGAWYLRDNFSKNGTALNGVKLEPGQRVRLKSYDKITFARTEQFLVQLGSGLAQKYKQKMQPRGEMPPTLQQLALHWGGQLPEFLAVELGLQLCELLLRLHERTFPQLLLDLRPANLELTCDGALQVVDDSSAVPMTNRPLARPEGGVRRSFFQPPEGLECEGVLNFTTDVYALGAVITWMLAGPAAPYPEQVDLAALRPDVAAPLRNLLAACTRYDQTRRVADVQTVREQLRQLAPPAE